jgi:hypothetical protein
VESRHSTGKAPRNACYYNWCNAAIRHGLHRSRSVLRLLMIAAAAFFLVGIVHGNGVWFGGW